MSVFTDQVSITPFLLIIAGVVSWKGLSYLQSILVKLGEIKLAVEPQPRCMVKPQNIFTEPSPFELFTPSQRKLMGLDKLMGDK